MPVMVRRNGRLAIVAGTMGGEAQPQIHAELLSGLLRDEIEIGLSATERAPTRPGTSPPPSPRRAGSATKGRSSPSPACPRPASPRCSAAGMPVETLEPLDDTVGHAHYVRIAADGALEAATDPRADGAAYVGAA